MQQAIRFIYSELLASGVQLYEWNQSVLHAKVALFDESSFTIGSYNLNHLSQFSSVETNLVSTDFNAYQDLKSIIDIELLPYCERISIEQLQQKRNRITHLFQYLSFTLVVALFRLYQRLIYNKNNS
jgi:cardiolipin synthase